MKQYSYWLPIPRQLVFEALDEGKVWAVHATNLLLLRSLWLCCTRCLGKLCLGIGVILAMLSATDEWICCWLWSTYFGLLGTVFVSWFSQKWQLRLQSCPPETARIPLGNGRCPGNTSWRQQERPSCFIFFHDLCCLCKWFVCQGKMPEGHEPPSDWLMYDLTPDSYKRLQAIKLLKVRDRLYLWSFLMIPQGQGLMDSGFCPLECEVGKLNKLRAPNEHRLIDFRSVLLNQILHREVSNRGQGETAEKCIRWFELQ